MAATPSLRFSNEAAVAAVAAAEAEAAAAAATAHYALTEPFAPQWNEGLLAECSKKGRSSSSSLQQQQQQHCGSA